ncbi:vegetative cell wall protein gp1-like [Esox lucius]|uniref:vegetative cell wall protein gp1-like n=1 Tax=Esox lucius TaxID=8010 RepID=UPI0014769C62|nr:vegetative cell wall protein gp1-like [Esox lucius]
MKLLILLEGAEWGLSGCPRGAVTALPLRPVPAPRRRLFTAAQESQPAPPAAQEPYPAPPVPKEEWPEPPEPEEEWPEPPEPEDEWPEPPEPEEWPAPPEFATSPSPIQAALAPPLPAPDPPPALPIPGPPLALPGSGLPPGLPASGPPPAPDPPPPRPVATALPPWGCSTPSAGSCRPPAQTNCAINVKTLAIGSKIGLKERQDTAHVATEGVNPRALTPSVPDAGAWPSQKPSPQRLTQYRECPNRDVRLRQSPVAVRDWPRRPHRHLGRLRKPQGTRAKGGDQYERQPLRPHLRHDRENAL